MSKIETDIDALGSATKVIGELNEKISKLEEQNAELVA